MGFTSIPVFLLAIATILTTVKCRDDLVFVIELARHGARYPELTEHFDWNVRPMQLSSAGMRQHYIIGKQVNKRYIVDIPLIKSQYDPDEFLVLTSNSSRCRASATAQLLGIYDLGTGAKIQAAQAQKSVPPNPANYTNWIAELKDSALNYTYQSIPINSVDEKTMIMLDPEAHCEAISKMHKRYRTANKEKIEAYEKEHFTEIYQRLANALKVPSKMNIDQAIKYRDVIICALYEGIEIQSEETMNDLIDSSLSMYQYGRYDTYLDVNYDDQEIHKIIATPILSNFSYHLYWAAERHIRKTTNQTSFSPSFEKLKFLLFVGPQSLIEGIMRYLGNKPRKYKYPFATTLFLEMYKNSSRNSRTQADYYVRITLNRDVIVADYDLTKLVRDIEQSVYSSAVFDKICPAKGGKKENEETSQALSKFLGVFLGLLIGIFMIFVLTKILRSKYGPRETTLLGATTQEPGRTEGAEETKG